MMHNWLVFEGWSWGTGVQWPWPRLPGGLHSVQEHFTTTQYHALWFWALAALGGGLLFLLAWRSVRILRIRRREMVDRPEKIFTDLVGALDLGEEERLLLQRLTVGARLRHPIMCLLSPGLLEWARQLWLQDKGAGVVTEEITERLHAISVKLYDHRPDAKAGLPN